jgi:adenylate cyclase
MFLIIVNVAAVMANFNEGISRDYHDLFKIIEIISVSIFSVEYLLRLWTAKFKFPDVSFPHLRFVISFLGITDLLAILPFFLPFIITVDLRFLRIFRLFRIVIKIIRAIVASEREKRFIRQAFSTYLSPNIVAELIADPSKLNLGGEKRAMTALFTDLRSFSTISENMDPTHLVQILNKYLTIMSNILMGNQGTIDKYIGDAIVAFFGAPIYHKDHAKLACMSALSMKWAEEELNSIILSEGLCSTPLFTRIGINTGEMVVGNMGSEKKMNYTVMGSAVNLAARIEGVNKFYETGIIISEFTKNQIDDSFLCRQLDRVRVSGLNTPILLYELVGLMEKTTQEELAFYDKWKEAITCFEQCDFSQALELFNKLAKERLNDRTASLYINRCNDFLKKPPAHDWDGVFNFTEK